MSVPRGRFPGGLRLPTNKALSNASPARAAPLPQRLCVPLAAHVGTPSRPCVRSGERVRRGQVVAEPSSGVSVRVHASSSGRVLGVEELPVAGRGPSPCIVIEADGDDEPAEPMPPLDWRTALPPVMVERVRQAGIVGMGGAGFPTYVKLREAAAQPVDTLIVNGVECEPFITCDDRLMRERPAEVLEGARILRRIVGAARCVVAVEADMPEALAALRGQGAEDIEVMAVPAIYPAGSEKQLILTVTGREVPVAGLPVDVGVVMNNVATVHAVYEAVVRGLPLTERLVTASGLVAEPGNLWLRVGSAVADALAAAGGAPTPSRSIVGGPMMGHEVTAGTRLAATSNCVLVLDDGDPGPEQPCIRCGICAEVCPVRLQPHLLDAAALEGDVDRLQALHLYECVECGCCAYVCPSRIPLVAHYRQAKAALDRHLEAAAEAQRARRHFEEHERRRARAQGQGGASPAPVARDRRAEIAAAVARARARRADR